MGGETRLKPRLWLLLVLSGCLRSQLARAQDQRDVFFINDTSRLCVNDDDVPNMVAVSDVTNRSAYVKWNAETTVPSNEVVGFEILYWPVTSTVYQSVEVNNVNAIGAEIEGLHPYTVYLVAVRRFCSGELYGRASATGSFTTEAIEPGAMVTNVSASLAGNFKLNITWQSLQEKDWNGMPFGFAVYIFMHSLESLCSGETIGLVTETVVFPATSLQTNALNNGCYRVNVFPINHKAWGPRSEHLFFTFMKFPQEVTVLSADEVPSPPTASSTSFLESSYVYIMVVGVLAVVPIVMGIVLFKKAREKKRNVQYCRGIDEAPHSDIRLYPMSPSSGSSAHVSPHPPNSRLQTFSPLSNPSPVTPSHPLLSPQPPPEYAVARDVPNTFTMPAQSPTSVKFPLGVSPGIEGGVPRSFTMDPTTPVDVFVGVQSGSAGQGSHRPRANTEGGMHMPNPYEHPVHPGGASTLPRADFGMRSNGGGEHGDIPPPPCHAPPPLTHSSLEIFARMRRSPTGGGGKNGHQHQQQKQSQRGGGEHQHHGMSHRSFSTTQTAGLISPTSSSLPNSGSMRMIRSAGQLHPLEEKSSQELGPEYATVYPPMPMEGKVATLERQPPPRRGLPHSPNQPPPHGGAYVPNGSNRSTRNSDDFSSFSEMTDTGSAQLSMGQAGHGHMPAPLHSPRHPEMAGSYHLSGQRESVFSETSNEEQSLSSGSIREASPSGIPGWMGGSVDGADHKRSVSSSSTTPTNIRTSHNQIHSPPPVSSS